MRAGTTLLAAFPLVLACGARCLAQTPTEQFELAVSAFEYQDYDKAISLLRPLLEPEPTLPSAGLVLRGREMLGASLWWKGKSKEAQLHFTKLLVARPDYELDSFYYPKEMVSEFEVLRKRLAEAGIIESRDPVRAPGVECPAAAPAPEGPLVSLVPFGLPQFFQGRTLAGSLFLSGQALSLGTNVGAWAYMYYSGAVGSDRDLAVDVMYGSVAVFAALYVWGIIDALVAAPAATAPAPTLPAPDKAVPGPAPSPGPAGHGGPGILLDMTF
jgi:tetratricopeptide (TPR) repeat protein